MNFRQSFEFLDPGYFAKRHDSLLKTSKEIRSMGFFPLKITENDIDCNWIRLETIDGGYYSLYEEMWEDMKIFPDLLKALKEVARYEER